MNKGSRHLLLIKEEPDRIPYDDMGEFNGKNIEDEATVDGATSKIDDSL